MLRRAFPGAALVAAAALIAAAPVALGQQGGAPPEGAAPPRIVDFAGAGGRWAWIVERNLKREAFYGPRSQAGTPAPGEGEPVGVAVAGQETWLLRRRGSTGELVQLGGPGRLAGLRNPAGLGGHEGRLCWAEAVPSSPGLGFVPPLGPRLLMRIREADGSVRSAGEWPVSTGLEAPPAVEFVGGAADAFVVRLRRVLSTEFLRIGLPGGGIERLAIEAGDQVAALYQGDFWWTAPSEEATAALRCLRRLPGAAGTPETVGDWLPSSGILTAAASGLYYWASGGLYRMRNDGFPEEAFPPPAMLEPVRSDGESLVRLGSRLAPEALAVR